MIRAWLLVATSGVLLACRQERGAGAAPDTATVRQPVVGARTATATTRAFAQVVTAIGTVTPRPGRFAELAAPAPT